MRQDHGQALELGLRTKSCATYGLNSGLDAKPFEIFGAIACTAGDGRRATSLGR